MFGEDEYLEIDRKNGLVVRIWGNRQSGKNRTIRQKNDMIVISYAINGTRKEEQRVILEVVNEYTFVLDRSFDGQNFLPD